MPASATAKNTESVIASRDALPVKLAECLPPRTAQQVPVAANPQGTAAFVAGANEGASSVVGSTLIVLVSPAPPLLVYVLVE
jgi:hypothetical protein